MRDVLFSLLSWKYGLRTVNKYSAMFKGLGHEIEIKYLDINEQF
jgi:hypothetical protein